MEEHLEVKDLSTITALITSFFPDCRLLEGASSLQTMDNGEILCRPDQFLSYLQTVFFEEHLLELQLDKSTRVFFANILDDVPALVEQDVEGEIQFVAPEYESGSYLQKKDTLVLTPLTPAIGNARIRTCEQIIVRFFCGTTAIEFGCTFRQTDSVRDIPVLRLNFPVIGRVNKSYRNFRVKAVSTVAAQIVFKKNKSSPTGPETCYQIVDISAMGLGFEIPAEFHPFVLGEMMQFTIRVPDIKNLEVSGQLRHVSKVRDKKSYKNICGVQFDLETRSLAAEIERVAAAIQRLQLRELAEKTENLKGVLLIK